MSTWTIDLVGGSNNSTLWAGGSYLLPLTLTYGGEWNITIRGTNGGFDSAVFFVRTYSVQLFLSQSAYLPGHTGEAYYYVNATVNDAPYTQLSTVTATASYLTATSTVAPLPDLVAALGTAPRGEFPFTVPTNANDFGDVDLELFANASGAGPVPNSASGLIVAPVGHLETSRVTLGGCAFTCSSSTFASGSPVFVSVVAMIAAPGISAPVGGMGLTIQFEKDNVPIPIGSVAGDPPSTITTNANGDAAVMFIATSPPFSLGSGNYVNVTLSDPLNSLNAVANGSASFALTTPQVTSPALGVAFVGSQFYGGNNATVTWQFGGLSTSNATGWIVDGWWVWSLGNAMLVQSGTIGSSSGKGSFQLTLPTGYVGELEVTVSAHNATASIVGVAYANASAPTIVLSVSDLAYYPGGSVSVTVATEGSALNGVPLYETVVGPSGLYLSNGPVINDRISFTIPTFGAPPSVTITVTAQSALLGVIAQARQTIPEASGVALTLGVSTASQYSDGSYQPGQQVQDRVRHPVRGRSVRPPRVLHVRCQRPGADRPRAGGPDPDGDLAVGDVPLHHPERHPVRGPDPGGRGLPWESGELQHRMHRRGDIHQRRPEPLGVGVRARELGPHGRVADPVAPHRRLGADRVRPLVPTPRRPPGPADRPRTGPALHPAGGRGPRIPPPSGSCGLLRAAPSAHPVDRGPVRRGSGTTGASGSPAPFRPARCHGRDRLGPRLNSFDPVEPPAELDDRARHIVPREATEVEDAEHLVHAGGTEVLEPLHHAIRIPEQSEP